ncbi:MAG: CPBP family intramembrane metalloprotease [Planctomycetes bacterium]|nr:CPBP family intramembrane metalloprotease [Planctomycetota bacterium]
MEPVDAQLISSIAAGPPPPPESPRRIGAPGVAWFFIMVLVLAIVGLRQLGPVLKPETGEDVVGLLNMRMVGRYLVGAAALGDESAQKMLYKQAEPLNTGTIPQRLQFVTLAGELGGPAEALKHLRDLNEKLQSSADDAAEENDGSRHKERPSSNGSPTAAQAEVIDVLGRLYGDYEQDELTTPSVTPKERDLLRQELGWFGELALAPEGGPDAQQRQQVLLSAQVTMVGLVALFGGFLMLALGGFAGLIVCLVLWRQGQLRGGVLPATMRHGVYAETFACWMALFLVLSGLAGFVGRSGGSLWLNLAAFFLSLAALGWPVLRGVPWQTVRQDIGWTHGRLRVAEPLMGLVCYAMAVPILLFGIIVTLMLIAFATQLGWLGGVQGEFDPTVAPSHPVVNLVAEGGWLQWLQILLLASVAAPIVEETMFRGVLYAHLRGATQKLGTAFSILASALINGVLFAVIHPQGLLAVPALTAIAVGFSLTREWRGSLIPSMIAHGVHNGALMVLLILFLAG